MLTALSIRDIVLIEKLDISFEDGMTVLTGETGAGKSILLDAFGLALGARGDSTLVRAGAEKGVVTAAFSLGRSHPAIALLEEQGIETDSELVIRRLQMADGPSRATINDQPVSLNLLRQVAVHLTEIHGQHADRALVDTQTHRHLLDAYGGLEREARDVADLWQKTSAAQGALAAHRALIAKAEAERDYLTHAAEELRALAPQGGEEAQLTEMRQIMMNAEQFAAALNEAEAALNEGGTFAGRVNAALRKLERRRDQAGGRLDRVCQTLDRLVLEAAEADAALSEAQRSFAFDAHALEKADERLFALRAAARKYKCGIEQLPEALERFETDLKAISDGAKEEKRLAAAAKEATIVFEAAAKKLSARRVEAGRSLDTAVAAELPPLKLERARFETRIDSDAARPGAHGFDRVEFLVAANPGTPLAPLMKVASGGELARFMLALKVILAAEGSAPTLIFDEIDTGVGGAVADAVGSRLARLAKGLQVVAVTHSPQVAARAGQHFLISKMQEVDGERMVTRVHALSSQSRREEIARMLSGAKVTKEARAQAERLISGRG